MPHNPLTRARKNTVKAPLTPQTPGDWLLARYELLRDLVRRREYSSLLYDDDGDRRIYIQPMFSLKALVPPDPDECMSISPGDYADQSRWWL